MRFVSKTKECFAYNTKIIETPTTKEVYIYENPIFIHSKEKADLTDTNKRKNFKIQKQVIHKHINVKYLMKCRLISNMTV